MQRIEIHNFGPIKDATIEIPKFLLLIGEQASGKSTVAKLIYFFKSLREDFIQSILKMSCTKSFSSKRNLEIPIRQKFLIYFGMPSIRDCYSIVFYYSENKFISLKWTHSNLEINLSPDFIDESLKRKLRNIRKKYTTNNQIEIFGNEEFKKELSDLSKECFCLLEEDPFYIVADRSATVSFGHLFERVFSRELDNSLLHLTRVRTQSIEELLLRNFLDRVALLKDYFSETNLQKQENPLIKWILKSMSDILKGNYSLQYNQERISWGEGGNNYVYLRNASSGQQEVIRVLQDIVWVVRHNVNAFRIVEEPESHLFPLAQKKLVELLSAMVRNETNNSLVITTHSPYILSSINNLLFAQQVVNNFPELQEAVQKEINQHSWIDSKDFRAYALSKSNTIYCRSILEKKTGMIAQNYLDSVSDEISKEFNQIYQLYLSKLREKK